MGLDLVEFVMRVEEEFEVEIPDQAAGLMLTPKDVIDYLITKPNVVAKFNTRDRVAEEVWEVFEDELGLDPTEFSEDSNFYTDMHVG